MNIYTLILDVVHNGIFKAWNPVNPPWNREKGEKQGEKCVYEEQSFFSEIQLKIFYKY